MKLAVVLLLSCLTAAVGREFVVGDNLSFRYYNRTLAKIMVRYASAVYLDDSASLLKWNCSRCNGVIKDFHVTALVVDVRHCLQAFVGVSESLHAIVIAFRGTQENSMANWMEDLYFKELDLNYPGTKDAKVHHGFYSAYHNTSMRASIMAAISYIEQTRHGLKYMVTGHSMGGALASFCALDLIVNYKVSTDDVEIVTFGQPRLGNTVFAKFFSKHLPRAIRMTHGHDMVPHLPPYLSFLGARSYHHFAREVWITTLSIGILTFEYERVCDSSGEDPTCSRSVSGNSIEDHFIYLGVYLGSGDT
ncbi:lipase [Selaginella moellendorffii]|uniref:lipase n=1 Tax=Selaginella moellendorffii TaxID=88036 RepID=UPI000D1CC8C9|nr:lipase [Selaginella moellendorffii]XP_024528306.1 lipase [Selaginella moellendorffii]XP_024528307.1 lipase [Selaginella moellendorffii]|eukprot:XP_024528305.1 lipase [Selaginella moellendorffii]